MRSDSSGYQRVKCVWNCWDKQIKETNPENSDYHSQAQISLQWASKFVSIITFISIPTFEKSNLFYWAVYFTERSWYNGIPDPGGSLGNIAAVIIMIFSEEKDKTQSTLTHNGKLNLFPFGKQFQ